MTQDPAPQILRQILGSALANYKETNLFNPSGEKIWEGQHAERKLAIDQIRPYERNNALAHVLGIAERMDNSPFFSSKQIFKKAIELGFINQDNNVPGFVTTLPKTKIIERIVEKINSTHFKKINAVEISFPTFFDYQITEMQELAKSYEFEERMFKLGGADEGIRVSYAADPGLFLWLKNKKFRANSLPYAVYTYTQVYRRFKGGELGGFPRLREFPMPDLHIICNKKDAKDLYLENVKIAAENMRFLLGEDWTFSIDITPHLLSRLDGFIQDICKAIKKHCVVNILSDKPRYYDIKSVFMMDAGDCAIMNYNMQWDEENPKRFNISSEEDHELVILHGTLMHSWYKILPVFINRVLTGKDEGLLPYHVSPLQISILPTSEDYIEIAENLREKLISNNIRTAILAGKKNISKAIKLSHKNLIPYFIVIGGEEAASKKFYVTSAANNQVQELNEFINKMKSINNLTPVNLFERYDFDDLFV